MSGILDPQSQAVLAVRRKLREAELKREDAKRGEKALEVHRNAVRLICEQLVKRDRDLAVELMDYFNEMKRITSSDSVVQLAEQEIADGLDWAFWCARESRPTERNGESASDGHASIVGRATTTEAA